jgi:hypothetical protein
MGLGGVGWGGVAKCRGRGRGRGRRASGFFRYSFQFTLSEVVFHHFVKLEV